MWHFDQQARDCKCSFCGNIRFDRSVEWETCDDIGDRHPTHVYYEVCPCCRGAVAEAIEKVLQGDVFSPVLHDGDLTESGQSRDQSE